MGKDDDGAGLQQREGALYAIITARPTGIGPCRPVCPWQGSGGPEGPGKPLSYQGLFPALRCFIGFNLRMTTNCIRQGGGCGPKTFTSSGTLESKELINLIVGRRTSCLSNGIGVVSGESRMQGV